ncbi:MAG TPA: hypothetical protein VGL59_13350 [Polyangia bacterium]|jgi:hypothetical protein
MKHAHWIAGCFLTVGAALGACNSAGISHSSDAGTGGTTVVDAGATGTGGSVTSVDSGTPVGGTDAAPPSNCVGVSAAGVYVLDVQGTLLRFDPGSLAFTRLGDLNCPGVASGDYNSMAVDRNGFAWVNAVPGGVSRLFKLDLKTLACSDTTFDSQDLQSFGMGFSSDQAGSSAETLFIDSQVANPLGNSFGSIGFPSLGFTSLGGTDGSLEFTGTGDAQLWGFRPEAPAVVGQIDKTSGAFIKTFPAPEASDQIGQVAYAFAFWADTFWIFLKDGGAPSTSVYSVARSNGAMATAIPDTKLIIVGAGVSTCAPFVIP